MKKILVSIETHSEKVAVEKLIKHKKAEVIGQLLPYKGSNLELSFLNFRNLHYEEIIVKLGLLNWHSNKASNQDIKLLEAAEHYAPIFYDMCQRFDTKKNHRFEERRRLWQYLLMYWSEIQKKTQFNLVYFSNTPHEPSTFTLYIFAKLSQCKVFLLQENSILDTRVLISDIYAKWQSLELKNDSKSSSELARERALIDSIGKAMERKKNEEPFWLLESKQKAIAAKLLIKREKKGQRVLNIIKGLKGIIKNEVSDIKLNYSLNGIDSKTMFVLDLIFGVCSQYRSIYNFRLCYREYLECVARGEVIIDNTTIVFFLSYNPENSVNPLGKSYFQQFLAISQIYSALPKGLKLIVKEHPAQFNQYAAGYNYVGRELGFYKNIQSLGVDIITDEISSQELLGKCLAVATISGTVGWEASIIGKPVLLFGTTWYEESPNIIRVNPQSNLMEILNNLHEYTGAFTKSSLLDFVQKCFDASLYLPSRTSIYNNMPDIDKENIQIRWDNLFATISGNV